MENSNVLEYVRDIPIYVISILWNVMKAEITVNGVNLPLRPTIGMPVLK